MPEILKEIWDYISKEATVIKAAPVPFIISVLIVAVVIGIGVRYYYAETINTQRETISALKDRIGTETKAETHGAFISRKQWSLVRTQQLDELQLVGLFSNIGDIDTTATLTTKLLLSGEDVTEPR